MDKKILSICIPVYNRESELRECLKSIERNYVTGLEVVISDNNSTDRTLDVIKDFAARMPIVWTSKEENSGFDENCINVISMSSGEYCWILGSDDKVNDGAISFLINKIILNKDDILHFAYIQQGVKVSPINDLLDQELSIADHAAKIKYIGELKNLSLAFMFISCFAFKREKWMDKKLLINECIGTNYVHAFVLHSILSSKSSIYATNEVLVDAKLSHNEWAVDVGKFLYLDCLTIVDILNRVKFDAIYFHSLCKIFIRTYPIQLILKIMVAGGGNYYIKSEKYLYKIGYGSLYLKLFFVLEVSGIIKALYYVNKLRKKVVSI